MPDREMRKVKAWPEGDELVIDLSEPDFLVCSRRRAGRLAGELLAWAEEAEELDCFQLNDVLIDPDGARILARVIRDALIHGGSPLVIN